jgi:tetratricopeptide (TPR) repeat protein
MNTAIDLIAKAKEQSRLGQYADAIVSAEAATKAAPESADAWWQLSLSYILSGHAPAAIPYLEQTLKLAPHYAYGWACLGKALIEIEELERAEQALLQALKADANEDDALRALIGIYRDSNREDDEYPLLDRLSRLIELPTYDQTRLGNFYLHRGRPLDAIECYTRGLRAGSNLADLFNLGLAYAHAEVSQDADAADRWRLVQRRYPEFEKPKAQLDHHLPRLLELASKARKRKATLLSPAEYFHHYVNPFELLRVDAVAAMPDDKALLRLRKALLQEIELEGRVAWMEDAAIDRSRVIGLCEELNDITKRQYHWLVFQNRPLLRFLTRGDHEHFLVHQTNSPLDVLEALEQDAGFAQFLSQPFARQYSSVLMKALDQEELTLAECYFDGRRWVTSADSDLCFEAARRKVDGMMEPLRTALPKAHTTKPALKELELTLRANSLLAILNLLPTQFRDFQHEAPMLIRNIAVAAYNKHGDSELSKNILNLCTQFNFRSAAINQSLREDYQKITELIQEERKYEINLTSGKTNWRITREGATDGKVTIKAEHVTAMRWGILVERGTLSNTLDFLIAVFSEDDQILFAWKASKDHDTQQGYFNDMVRAVMSYILPSVLEKLDACRERGESVKIGTCTATKTGVQFTTEGWFRTKTHNLPWGRVGTKMENGTLRVYDKSDPGAKTVMDFRQTENAFVLALWAERYASI